MTTGTAVALFGMAVVMAAAVPLDARAQAAACSGIINIGLDGPDFAIPTSEGGSAAESQYTVTVGLGAGTIDPPGTITVNRFRYNLDCQIAGSIDVCTDDGDAVSFLGVTDNRCGGVTFTCAPDGGNPNQIICTPDVTLQLLAGSAPNQCEVDLLVQVDNRSTDATPDRITAAIGASQVADPVDWSCSNSAPGAFPAQSLSIDLGFVQQPSLGCRITAGGIVDDGPEVEVGTFADIRRATFGGQVGAPCGCIGCFDDLDSVQGQWTHNRKVKKGRFHASDFNSLVCDLDEGEGPEPRPAPANKACWSGIGKLANNGGKRTERVAFRVEVEDRGEPGAGVNAGDPDVYRIRMWFSEDPDALLDGICCTNAQPVGVPDPDVDDGGDLIHGNIQIHPVLPNTVRGICPPPNEVQACFDEANNTP